MTAGQRLPDPTGVALAFVEALLENGVDGVAAFDADLSCVYWGPVLAALTGVAATVARGQEARDLLPALRLADEEARLRDAMAGRCSTSTRPLPVTDVPDTLTTWRAFYSPLHGASGGILGAVVVIRDRLAHHELVQQLGETDSRFRRMADSAPVLLWMSARDGQCEFFNQTWLDFTGRTLEQEAGYGWAEGVHAEDSARCIATYTAAFDDRVEFEMEYRLRRHDGEQRWLLDRGAPRYTPDGQFAGFIGSCVDITERKEAEESLRRTTLRLEKANADLDRFAYIASHDLKAPLRAIDALATIIDEDLEQVQSHDVGETRVHLKMLHTRVDRMERMLTALLRYSQAGHSTDVVEPVDLRGLVAEIADTMRAERGRRRVTIEHAPALPVMETARVPLEHVLSNLLANAMKHHDRPEVRVTVTATDVGDHYEIAVADDGPGIPPEFHRRVFEIFQTLKRRDEVEGTGLGLSLVKKLVEISGGTVQLQSPLEAGRGTAVRFTWPKSWKRSAG